MAERTSRRVGQTGPAVYEITVEGHLADLGALWFEGMSIVPDENGDTRVTGWVTDQAALHGLLSRVRDLGAVLVGVIRIEPETGADLERKGPETGADLERKGAETGADLERKGDRDEY